MLRVFALYRLLAVVCLTRLCVGVSLCGVCIRYRWYGRSWPGTREENVFSVSTAEGDGSDNDACFVGLAGYHPRILTILREDVQTTTAREAVVAVAACPVDRRSVRQVPAPSAAQSKRPGSFASSIV